MSVRALARCARRVAKVLAISLGTVATASADSYLTDAIDRVLADPELRQQLHRRGEELGRECAQCHGIDGNSSYSWVPNLAAQNPWYLAGQVGEFVDGSRADYVMTPLMRRMGEADHLALVIFFAGSSLSTTAGGTDVSEHPGGRLYQSRCVRCHGVDARGDREYARLASQQKDYLVNSIRAYQTGQRTADVPGLLEAIADLDPAQVDQVADYLSRLP